ncbi:MAG: 16S rRNA (guanine527-N7)-methyltransferase [Candidatus Peregrinibacteria bacterium Greene0416_62]|nr:MAG: 16S rRNA (guanine527-N7)-methyltransferase [Candidatus Peregrinibacteria bacterium Greene0416_62]TSC99418.1 MAG: 16S rRNA (guanine527-N7)-methyltransferase [Candidatus Peregrinibacteria bacterium Greene1014_49]
MTAINPNQAFDALPKELQTKLQVFTDIFLNENKKINLSAHRTKERVWMGNVMDSLAAVEWIASQCPSIPRPLPPENRPYPRPPLHENRPYPQPFSPSISRPLPPREEGGAQNNGWIKQVTPKNILLYARTMRKHPTGAEEVLWKLIRNDVLGIRFRRQYPLGGRILDFYAPSIGLGIEADGEIHSLDEAQINDALRSQYLADDHHVCILRFSNDEILQQSNKVISKIKAYIQKHTHPLPPVEEGLGMEGLNILDLGTGGGFPLLPLAIALPQHHFTGLDSVRKKMDAVQRIVKMMKLSNVTLITGRSEELGHDPSHRKQYDIVTARAVAETSILLEYCAPFLKVGGHILLWKSMDIDEEISSALRAEEQLHLRRNPAISYDLGGIWGKRQILVYKKIKATPKEYPRPVGSAKMHPL